MPGADVVRARPDGIGASLEKLVDRYAPRGADMIVAAISRGLIEAACDAIQRFVGKGGDVNTAVELNNGEPENACLLHRAAGSLTSNGIKVVDLLLQSGATPRCKDEKYANRTPLHLARTPEIARLLVAAGANPNARSDHGETPLMRGSLSGAMAGVLLEAGSDPRICDHSGAQPLHCADDALAVRLLVAAGADPNGANRRGETPLMAAVSPGVSAALIECGADANVRDADGGTALMRLCLSLRDGVLDQMALLVEAGADVNATNREGRSALALACHRGAVECFQGVKRWGDADTAAIVRALIGYGACTEVEDSAGETPLLKAARLQGPQTVMALLNAGASCDAVDAEGRDFVALAQSSSNHEVRAIGASWAARRAATKAVRARPEGVM